MEAISVIENRRPVFQRVLPLIISLVIFILLLTIGFLASENWQLNQRLNALSTTTPTPSLTPTPTTDPTADWKTFTNGNYNYLFKYPNDWPDIPQVLPNQKDGFQLAGQTIYLSQTFPQVRPPQIQIEAFRSEKVLGQDQLEDKESCGAPTFTTSKSSIGGAPAIIGRRLAPRDPSAPYYTGLHYCARTYFNGIIYNFLWEEGTDTNSSLFDQILSTFKFIDNNNEGTLKATVMRSPTCAGAQSPGEICEAPYADGTFKIIRLPDNEVVQTVTTDKNGALTVSLASGTYTLQNIETGIGKRISNSNFTITSGETTIQRFDVDTGIR